MRLAAAVACAVTLICLGVPPGHAEKRVALVIGNDRYAELPPLRNAVADAQAVAQVLDGLGFRVFKGENLDYRAANRLHADFEAALAPGDTAFVFFSGHGVAIGAENYLLPTDMEKPGAGEENLVRSEAHSVDVLVRRVQGKGAAASFFVIDACRDNPFDAVGVKSIGSTKGLARIDAPTGVFVFFSAGIGQTALDRLNAADRSPNSVFTRTLVPLLQQPGLTHLALAKRVQTQVKALAATVGHRQQPAFYDQIDGELVFKPAPQASEPKPPSVAAFVPPVVPSVPAGPCGAAPMTVSWSSRSAQPLSAIEECALRPKDVFRECEKCPEMLVVAAGSFTMGSPAGEEGRADREGPPHAVTIAKPFAMGKFHITVDQFAAFVTETGYDAGSKCRAFEGGKWEEIEGRSWRNPGFAQAGSHPVVCINWNDAKAYVAWLSSQTHKPYRLLTEAEWEYATRAGTTTRYSFGDDEKDMCRYGNGADQTAKSKITGADNWTVAPCSDGYAYTSPAGSFSPNAFGLYDVHGNAWQWLDDCWNENYTGAPTDGSAWVSGDCSRRVLRGGSWSSDPRYLRAANRLGYSTALRSSNLGFRLGMTLTP